MIVDQKRFRMNLPQKMIKFFSLFIPKPDLIFYLKTDTSIALQRKNELNIKELERQNKEFIFLSEKRGDRFKINYNNGDFDTSVNKIVVYIFNILEGRLKLK